MSRPQYPSAGNIYWLSDCLTESRGTTLSPQKQRCRKYRLKGTVSYRSYTSFHQSTPVLFRKHISCAFFRYFSVGAQRSISAVSRRWECSSFSSWWVSECTSERCRNPCIGYAGSPLLNELLLEITGEFHFRLHTIPALQYRCSLCDWTFLKLKEDILYTWITEINGYFFAKRRLIRVHIWPWKRKVKGNSLLQSLESCR